MLESSLLQISRNRSFVARIDWISGIVCACAVERMVPFACYCCASRDRDDHVRNMCEWIWTSVAYDIVRGYISDRLVESSETFQAYVSKRITYAIIIWCTEANEVSLVGAVHIDFLSWELTYFPSVWLRLPERWCEPR